MIPIFLNDYSFPQLERVVVLDVDILWNGGLTEPGLIIFLRSFFERDWMNLIAILPRFVEGVVRRV